jgi:hypothetical protein
MVREQDDRSLKVGSSRDAATHQPGGENDFGIPAGSAAEQISPGGRNKGPEEGVGPMRSGATGTRTTGVGAPPGAPGSGSGGDLDPDVIGLDGQGGIAKDLGEHKRVGPDMTDGGSEAFASGGPAKTDPESRAEGEDSSRPVLDTVDHSGGDVTTSGDESDESANPEIEEIAQESALEENALPTRQGRGKRRK